MSLVFDFIIPQNDEVSHVMNNILRRYRIIAVCIKGGTVQDEFFKMNPKTLSIRIIISAIIIVILSLLVDM